MSQFVLVKNVSNGGQIAIAKDNQILATQKKAPTVVKVFPGGIVNVNTGTAGSSNAVDISPPIPGLAAANVYEAISELSETLEFNFPFSFGDATPATMLIANAGQLIRTVTITVTTPFNGVAPKLSVGDAVDVERLFPASSNDPTDANTEWVYTPTHRYAASTPILLSITPDGSTQGAGLVYIKRS